MIRVADILIYGGAAAVIYSSWSLLWQGGLFAAGIIAMTAGWYIARSSA